MNDKVDLPDGKVRFICPLKGKALAQTKVLDQWLIDNPQFNAAKN